MEINCISITVSLKFVPISESGIGIENAGIGMEKSVSGIEIFTTVTTAYTN